MEENLKILQLGLAEELRNGLDKQSSESLSKFEDMQKRLKELGDSTSEKMKEEVAQYKIDLEKEKKERERLLAAQQAEVLALQGTVTNLGQSLTDSLTPRVEKLEKLEKASVVAGAGHADR